MRYVLKIGKYGCYFHDSLRNYDLPLDEICILLNDLEHSNNLLQLQTDENVEKNNLINQLYQKIETLEDLK
jgi:hypothetical protein